MMRADTFGEVLIAAVVTEGPTPRVLPLLRGRAGAFMLHTPVTTHEALAGVRGFFGWPKFLADMDFTETGASRPPKELPPQRHASRVHIAARPRVPGRSDDVCHPPPRREELPRLPGRGGATSASTAPPGNHRGRFTATTNLATHVRWRNHPDPAPAPPEANGTKMRGHGRPCSGSRCGSGAAGDGP